MFYNKYLSILFIVVLFIASQVFATFAYAAINTSSSPIDDRLRGRSNDFPTNKLSSDAASILLDVYGAPSLVSKTARTVTIEWAKVPTAKYYVVRYSTSSVAQAYNSGSIIDFTNESDLLTTNGTTIRNLTRWTTYYFVVIAIDSSNNQSMTNSKELTVKLPSRTLIKKKSPKTYPHKTNN